MESQKQEIIDVALAKFKEYGIRSVTVDEICREIGMSKKTFYNYFPAKDDLITAVLDNMNQSVENAANAYMNGKSALDCIKMLSEMPSKVGDVYKVPPFINDLKKYYPQIYKRHALNVHNSTKNLLMKHLQAGISEGIYRADLDVEMCAVMYSILQQSFLRNEETIQTVSPRRLVSFAMESFFRSILTPEGEKKLKSDSYAVRG